MSITKGILRKEIKDLEKKLIKFEEKLEQSRNHYDEVELQIAINNGYSELRTLKSLLNDLEVVKNEIN